jgi:hypothetical protein
MTAPLTNIEALVPDFQYVADDRIVVTAGFAATLYFWGGHTSVKRMALIECVEAFENAYGSKLKWACDPDSWDTEYLADKELPKFRDYVASLDADDCIEWHLSSSDDRDAAAEYSISCLTERGWHEGRISQLSFQVPRSHPFDAVLRTTLEQLLFLCIEKLEPFHGHAGLAAVSPEESIPYEGDVFDVATRYMALYVEGAGDLLCAPRGPKSVNWLTIVGDLLAERLGGWQKYADYCRQQGIDTIRHGKSLVLRAGEFPEIAPISSVLPPAYIAANEALRPLRDGAYSSMGGGSIDGELRFNRCTSDLWMRRFDMSGIWPPNTLVGLTRAKVGKAPSKRLKLKSGDICNLHGRYRHPDFASLPVGEDDSVPQVVLLPGDVAPYWVKLGPHGEHLGRDLVEWELVAQL